MNEDLQILLLHISEELGQKDIQSILFLCGDKLSIVEKETIKDGRTLFSCLQKRELVSGDDLSFLKEIICKIVRKDILKKYLRMTTQELRSLEKSSLHISSYRSLLYDIAQSVDANEVKKAIFVLYPNKRQLGNTDSLMDVLREMEKDALLSEDNVKTLKETMKTINRTDLFQKLEAYEKQGEEAAACLDSKLSNMCIQESSGKQLDIEEDSHEPERPERVLEEYKLDKKPHGWCVILNNEDFKEARLQKLNILDRPGTNKDAEAIRKVFEPREYTVIEHKNLTKQKMLDVMKDYGQQDHSNMDSFVCFILSHGNKGTVLGTDGKQVFIKDLTSCFNGKNCKSLVGKPKVFFIQACRGDELDKGASYEKDSSRAMYENDAGASLPITADFLTAFSSVEEYESLRDRNNGSVYIQALCLTLEDPRFIQEDLKTILTSLQKKIADGNYRVEGVRVKQMPSHKSELRKALILPPKPVQ